MDIFDQANLYLIPPYFPSSEIQQESTDNSQSSSHSPSHDHNTITPSRIKSQHIMTFPSFTYSSPQPTEYSLTADSNLRTTGDWSVSTSSSSFSEDTPFFSPDPYGTIMTRHPSFTKHTPNPDDNGYMVDQLHPAFRPTRAFPPHSYPPGTASWQSNENDDVKVEEDSEDETEVKGERRKPRGRKKKFDEKLFEIIHDDEMKRWIQWNKTGTEIIVPDQEMFTENVLPKYFDMTIFESFVRQLYSYGFARKAIETKGAKGIRFSHPNWRRNRLESLRKSIFEPKLVRQTQPERVVKNIRNVAKLLKPDLDRAEKPKPRVRAQTQPGAQNPALAEAEIQIAAERQKSARLIKTIQSFMQTYPDSDHLLTNLQTGDLPADTHLSDPIQATSNQAASSTTDLELNASPGNAKKPRAKLPKRVRVDDQDGPKPKKIGRPRKGTSRAGRG